MGKWGNPFSHGIEVDDDVRVNLGPATVPAGYHTPFIRRYAGQPLDFNEYNLTVGVLGRNSDLKSGYHLNLLQ